MYHYSRFAENCVKQHVAGYMEPEPEDMAGSGLPNLTIIQRAQRPFCIRANDAEERTEPEGSPRRVSEKFVGGLHRLTSQGEDRFGIKEWRPTEE